MEFGGLCREVEERDGTDDRAVPFAWRLVYGGGGSRGIDAAEEEATAAAEAEDAALERLFDLCSVHGKVEEKLVPFCTHGNETSAQCDFVLTPVLKLIANRSAFTPVFSLKLV